MVLEAPVGPVMRVALAETEPLIPVAEAEAVEILEAQILFQAQAALALSLSAT